MPINRCHNDKCEYFNRPQPHDAKVCMWCGEPLGKVFPPSGLELVSSLNRVGVGSSLGGVPSLKLVHSVGQAFWLPGESGYIGRSSPTSPLVPEIDLKGIPNDGVISRGAHARVYWDAAQQSYMIVDNSSRNGTFLNGVPLKPDAPYRLNHGALLQLGQEGLVMFTVVVNGRS